MEVIGESEDKREKDATADGGSAGGGDDTGGAVEAAVADVAAPASLMPAAEQPPVVLPTEPAEPYVPATPATPAAASLRSEAPRPRDALPPVAATADLARPATGRLKLAINLAVCFIITFAIYVSVIPHFVLYGNPPTGDQPFYLMDVISMVQDWDLNVKNNYDNNDFDKFYNYKTPGFIGMTAPYPPGRQLADTPMRPPTEQYSAHLPGLPIFLIPGWIVGDWIMGGNAGWPWSLTMTCLLAALLSLNVFLLAYETTGKLWAGWAVWLPLAFSGPIMTYAYMIFTEMPVGLMVVYAFRRLALGWGANGKLRLLLIGVCIGYIPWLSLRTAPLAAVLVLYAAVQWWRYTRTIKADVKPRVKAESAQPVLETSEPMITLQGRPVRSQAASGTLAAEGRQTGDSLPVPVAGAVPIVREQASDHAYSAEVGEPATDVTTSEERFKGPTFQRSNEEKGAIGSRVRGALNEMRLRANWRTLPSTAWVVVPIILSAIILVGFNLFKAGTFIPASSEKGRVDHFYYPWAGSEAYAKFLVGAFGTFFDSRFGLFFYTPVYLLAIVGMIAMFRTGRSSDRRLLFWMAVLGVPYMLWIFTYEGWHGVWNPPARYVSSFVGLMAAPLAMALFVMTRNWITGAIYTIVYAVMSWPGIVTTYNMLKDARLMWPLSLSPVYEWLAQEKAPTFPNWVPTIFSAPFTFDVRPYFVNFVKPDEVAHPVAAARIIIAAVLVVLVLAVLLAVQRMMRTGRHWPIPARGAAWLGVFALLALGWYGMNDNYLKHKTVVTLDHKWPISAHLDEPYGIAYLDGKVYVTSFSRPTQGFVGALDISTGGFEIIKPTFDGQPVAFAHPSDVKVGPGALLYVLNNGGGSDTLWVMKPNGEIVRRLVLTGTTPIATGMNIGPDGSYYVADMLGGRIDAWNKDGGDYTATYGGPAGGFNNPSGVAVTDNGSIFAIENGNQLIYEIMPNGDTVRKYNPECRPIHGTTNGDWIDVSCENGLVSINTKSNYLQFSRFDPADSKPESLRGLIYGPNNTLFMLDVTTNSVISFKVTH